MKIAKSAALALLAFLVAYLMGAFYAISFDITMWTDRTCQLVAVFGGMASVFAFVAMAVQP